MQINLNYVPLPAAELFHASPAKFKLARGGKGSGKSLAMMMEGFMLSMEYPHNRGLLARETMGELKEVIIDPLLDITPPSLIAEYRKADQKLIYTNGSVIYFRPLDESRKFKGLNLGWFGIDEVDAAKEQDWLQLIGQLRLPGVRHSAMAATNPTSLDHWVYQTFVKEQRADHADFVFKTKDNRFLPKDFVDTLYSTMPESWVNRYLEGGWGAISLGDRVYPDFSEKLHVYDRLVFNPGSPVVRVWDFGLKGHAVVFFQLRGAMGADFLGEILKKDMTSRQFATVVARYCEENFPGAMFEDYGDVAGGHHDPTSGRSPIEEINSELRIRIITDKIPLKESIDLVRQKLSGISNGVTHLRFSTRMHLTIEALNGGYVFKKDRLGNVVSDTPASDEVFEHLMDCFRYGIWHKFWFHRPELQFQELPKMTIQWDETSW